jgi:predicted permease
MKILDRLKGVLGHRRLDSELQDELAFHVESEIQKNISAGMPPDEARRQALIAFGGVQQTKEAVRQVRWMRFVDVLVKDTRYALRVLRKSPAFTTVAVLTLALGIGMNTAIVSIIDAVLFRSLPVHNPDGLVVLKWEAREEPTTEGLEGFADCDEHLMDKAHPSGCALPLPMLQELKTHTNFFASLAVFTQFGQTDLGGNGPAKRVRSEFVSGGYFETLGVNPAIGRLLSAGDDQRGAPPVAVLNFKFWQSDFGGSRSVLGKTVRLNNKPFTIIGVTEPGFTDLSMANQFDLWIPLAQEKDIVARWFPGQTGMDFFAYVILGRLKPGVPVSQAEAAADVIFRNAILHSKPMIFKAEDDPHLKLVAAQKELRGRYDLVLRPVYVLMMCVGVILLIACANVAGLLLARAASREREMAVRLALGAKRLRLLSQLLVESLTLSLMGGALGLLMAVWGSRLLMKFLFSGAETLPAFSPHLDWRVLAFTAGAAVLTGVIFGLAPAFHGLRVDLTPSLKAADKSGAAGLRRRRFSMGNLLVALQVALAVLVLVTAGLLVRTLGNLRKVNPGFDTNNLLLFNLNPRLEGYRGDQVRRVYHELQEKLSSVPGVISVGYSSSALLSRAVWSTSFHRPGTPVDSKDQVTVDFMEVGPNFFATLRIPLLAGRDLTAAEFEAGMRTSPLQAVTAQTPVLVNHAFVQAYFPNQNPLGEIFGDSLSKGPFPAFPGWQIVGVVGNTKYNSLRRDMRPTIYQATPDNYACFELRTSVDPASLIPIVRKTVNSVDDNLAMVGMDTQKGEIDRQLADDRMVAELSSFFGLLALLLACMGLYGLLSYTVTRRTREIGIRMAIGAQAGNVIRLVMAEAILVAGVGAVFGTGVSFGTTRLLMTFLYGVKPGDPFTLFSVILLLAVVALGACLIPARRATRVDPLVALRYE